MNRKSLANLLAVTSAVAIALLLTGTAQARDAVTQETQAQPAVSATAVLEPVEVAVGPDVEIGSECEDPVSSSEAPAVADEIDVLTGASVTQAAACKPCKGRTWCKCTYNGMQRSSCDPCCYRNNIGVLTCLD